MEIVSLSRIYSVFNPQWILDGSFKISSDIILKPEKISL